MHILEKIEDLLSIYNPFHNILGLSDVFANFPFTKSETKWYMRVASRVAERLKILEN